MIRAIRFACTYTDESPITNAAIRRWLSATPRHPGARRSASSIRISRARKSRWGDPTGGTATSIELIQFDHLAVDPRHPPVHPAGQLHVMGGDQHRHPPG